MYEVYGSVVAAGSNGTLPLAGVTVRLYLDADGSYLDEQATDALGEFWFPDQATEGPFMLIIVAQGQDQNHQVRRVLGALQ